MQFKLIFTKLADEQLTELEHDPCKKIVLKAVQKALTFMECNIRHKSLQTHKFHGLSGPNKEEIFEAYVQQHTPGAYRIFWYYGPLKNHITIAAIVPHP